MSDQNSIEKREACRLVDEIHNSDVKISCSRDLSQYIIQHQVSRRYPNIAGHLEMKANEGDANWIYKNGIKPNWYAFVCHCLGLYRKGKLSHPVGFTPYRDL